MLAFNWGVSALSKALEFIRGLSMARLNGAFAGLAAVVGVIVLAYAYSSVEYRMLYTGHDEADVAVVIERLKLKGLAYKVDGHTIFVPEGQFSESSRYIESVGVVQASNDGFEIFDRTGIFLSEFTQRINYSRALSGELSKTIGQIDGVESARVHLVIPEKGIFGAGQTDGRPASAAVILTLRRGVVFTTSQAAAVAYLVAAGAPDLTPADVTVVDTSGRLLAGGNGATQRLNALGELRSAEAVIEDRLQAVLDKVVGHGRAVASVSIDMDTKRMGINLLISGAIDDAVSLEAMLKTAAGFSEKRGDRIVITHKAATVQHAPVFNPAIAPLLQNGNEAASNNGVGPSQSSAYLLYALAALIILLLVGFAMWMMKSRKAGAGVLNDMKPVGTSEDAARMANESVAFDLNNRFDRAGVKTKAADEPSVDAVNKRQTTSAVDVADIINRTPVSVIAEAFKSERPQIIAAVLSLMSAERGAELLEALPSGVRSDIKARAAGLSGLLPSALGDIADVLKARNVTAAQ